MHVLEDYSAMHHGKGKGYARATRVFACHVIVCYPGIGRPSTARFQVHAISSDTIMLSWRSLAHDLYTDFTTTQHSIVKRQYCILYIYIYIYIYLVMLLYVERFSVFVDENGSS